MSDENIHQVVGDLHDCSQNDGAFQAHKIVSSHICRNSKAVEKVPQPEITQRHDILEDLLQLYAEQEEHDAEQVQCNNQGENICCSTKHQ